MCGICGFTNPKGNGADAIKRMCQAMSHRGPDGEGIFIDRGIALGHRRLALVDIEHGAQPYVRDAAHAYDALRHDAFEGGEMPKSWTSESGLHAIVFNGEIYNFRELRSQLQDLGWSFQTHCDTEVLLVSYMQWGKACLGHLRGMFAFAIWDEARKQLFCARDPFGIKPFYYTLQGSTFIFASEIKSILQHPAYERRLNEQALDQYLCFQFSALPETFFRGIFKLPAAHWMTVDLAGRTEMGRYWEPTFLADPTLTLAEAEDRIAEAVAESVHAHAQADVPVGSLLSGGVDSSYLATRLKQEDDQARTFSVGFEECVGIANEVGHASLVASDIGISNSSRLISEADYWDSIETVLWHMDEPTGDPAAMALFFADELAATKVKAILSGEGADELFGGYRIYQAPLVAKRLAGFPKRMLGAAESALRALHLRGANFLHRCTHNPKDWYYTNANHLAFSGAERALLLKEASTLARSTEAAKANDVTLALSPERTAYPLEPFAVTAPLYDRVADESDITQMQYVDLNLWLVEDILQKTDKMAMAHSLEARVPYLDKRVFEVASALSDRLRVSEQETKIAFRRAAGRSLPPRSAARTKLGFPVPLCAWLRKPERIMQVKERFHGSSAREFFNTEYLIGLLDAHAAGKRDLSRRIWLAYAFLVWHELYFEKA